MNMHRRIEIACAPAQLWRCFTDVAILKQWISQLVDETPDDPAQHGQGALSTLYMREGKKIVAYRSMVTAWQPERRLAIRLSGGSFGQGVEMDVLYELSREAGARTILNYDVNVPLKGVLFRLMAPILWLASASNAKRDLAKLVTLAESMKP
jgi:carbon monoxide dehydrogenase subunit G